MEEFSLEKYQTGGTYSGKAIGVMAQVWSRPRHAYIHTLEEWQLENI